MNISNSIQTSGYLFLFIQEISRYWPFVLNQPSNGSPRVALSQQESFSKATQQFRPPLGQIDALIGALHVYD